MIAKFLIKRKISKKLKVYMEMITDLLEFRDYLTYRSETEELNSEELQDLLNAKHNIRQMIGMITIIGRHYGINIAKVVWNDTEIDIEL